MNRALPIWLLFLLALAGSGAAQTLDLTRTRIPGGGGASTGGQFGLFSTVGQPEAAPRSTGGAYELDTGLLSAAIPSPVPTVFFPQGTVTVLEDAGPQTRATYAVFEPGQAGEPTQPPAYQLLNNNPALFSVAPAIATDRTLTFTPATNANGTALVTVVVRADGADVATNTFAIVVTPVNDAPSVALTGNVAVLEDAGAQSVSSFATFTAGPADESTQTPAYAVTADNAALFSAQPAIAANGTLTFTPATNANGSATVTVVTVDGGGTANAGADRTTNIFTLTVTAVNDAPAVAYVTNHVVVLEDAGAQSVSGFAIFTAGPADESAQTPAYTLTADNAALFSAQPAIAANGALTFTPALNANGSATVTVITADSGGTSGGGVDRSTNSFTITVTRVNDAPSVAYATNHVVVLEDAGAQSVSGFATFTAGPADESAQAAAYTLTTDNAALFSGQPALAANGTLTFTPATNANGSAIVTVITADNGGVANNGADRSTNSFTITVTAVNDQPSVSYAVGTVTVLEDAGAQTVSSFATFTAGPADESAQTAVYTLTTDNAALFSVQPAIAANGTLTFTSAANANGSATVTVVLQDSGGTTGGGVDKATNTFSIAVTAVNDAPSVVFATNNVIAVKDTGAQIATGFAAFTAGPPDESAQTPAYTLSSDNAALFSVQPAIAANGTVTFTPAAGTEGVATVTVVVQDSGGTANGGGDKATNTFTITVVPFSTAPDSYAVSEDRLLAVAANVGVLANDVGVGLGVRLVDAATNGTVTLNANGSFTYLPATNFHGTDTFTYQATNSLVASAPTAVTITVSSVNDAPSVAYSTNEVVVLEDAGAQSVAGFAALTAGPTNESAQTLVGYTVSNSSNALFSVQPAIGNDGTLTFTAATNANGSATITVVVQDSGGTGDSGVDKTTNTFVITVTPVNDAPTAGLAGNVTVLEDAGAQTRAGFVTSFVPGPADEAGQTPTHQVASDNALLFSVQPAIASDGTLTFIPATNANGSATVTVITSDGGGAANGGRDRTTNSFLVTVTPVNDAPAVAFSTNSVAVLEDAGPQSFAAFATFTAGPANESAQALVGYTVSNGSNALFSVQPAIDGTGQLTFTPATNANGSATVTVSVQDNGGAGDGGVIQSTNTFTLTLTPVNDAPVVAFATNAVVVLEDSGAQSVAGFAALTAGPANESAQTLVGYTVSNSSNALFSVQPAIGNDGALTFTLANNANGSATATVIAQDSGGATVGGVDRFTNTFTISVTPVNDAPGFAFATNYHTRTVAWGSNVNGTTNVPAGLNAVLGFAAGGEHILAVRRDGTVAAWGLNDAGQTSVPAGLAGVTAVAAGERHSLALKSDGTVVGWGLNADAQTSVPVGLNGVTAISAGGKHSLALKSDGTVVAWGLNLFGESTVPGGLSGVTAIAAGYHHSVALMTDGTVVVWGYGGNGEKDVPAGLANVTAITAGYYHVLALKSDGTVVAWGYNTVGQAMVPAGLSGVRAVTAGFGHSIALKDDGTVVAWGINNFGQTDVPAGLSGVTKIVAGGVHAVALAGAATASVNVLEDNGAFSAGNFVVSISAGPANESSQVVGFTTTSDNAALFSAQPAVAADGTLTITPAANANGTATVTIVAQDDGGTANGGVDKRTNTFSIVVTPVNDAPVVTFAQANVTVLEDAGAQTLNAFATFSPGPANESAQALVGYTVTADNAALFAPAPAINNAGVLTFTPATNANGSATITVVVQDNGGTAAGGVDKSTNTFTIVVTAVNDTPVANNDSYTVSQGDVLAVTAAGVLASDTDVENNPLTATKLTNPTHGTITFNPNGGFTYTPDTNFYGVDSFTYRASDASSNSTFATVSLTVLARPVITPPPGKQRVFSSAALRFSATNAPDLNAIRVADPDSAALTLTLTVTNGTLAVTVTNGLTFPSGSTNTNTLVLAGLVTDLNAALESLAYISVTNYFGDDTLTLVAQDEGGRTNRGGGVFEIQVEIPARGAALDVSLDGFNNPGLGRTVTNATAVTLDTNLVQGITYDPTNNVVKVLPVGGQDGSTNRSTVTVLARYSDGTTELITVPVIIYQPLLTTTTNSDAYDATFGTPLFNLQTSLYEQKVRVQNNTPFDFTALRITATNLPATVTLQNATITNGGVAYIDYNLAVLAGSNVTLKLEYFSSDLRPFTPGLKLELLNQQRTSTAPTNTTMSAVAARRGFSPDGAAKNYLKFPTKLDQLYYVQYQDVAGPVWKTSPVTLRGTGFFLNWLDDGPPNTDTPPGPARFYRVVTDR